MNFSVNYALVDYHGPSECNCVDHVLGLTEGTVGLLISYFFSLDTLARPQWEAVVRGWGLASFWYDETMLVLCPDASITAAAQRFVEHL